MKKVEVQLEYISFFKGAARDYAADPKLSKEARRHFRKFKAKLDFFSAINQGRNAEVGKSDNNNNRAAMDGNKKNHRRYER